MGSQLQSMEESFESGVRHLIQRHDAHENHHSDAEKKLRAEYERRLREVQDKADRESQMFQEIIATIVASFSDNGEEIEDFSVKLDRRVNALVPKIEQVFDETQAKKIERQLSNLVEHLLSFEIKLRDTRVKKDELEAFVFEQSRKDPGEGLMGSSRFGAFRSARKGDYGEEPLDFLSAAEGRSLQDRHDQLNDSGEFRRLAEERNYGLRTSVEEIIEDLNKKLTNRRVSGEEQAQLKLKELISALTQFQRSHWVGAFGIINQRGELEGSRPTSKVVFEGPDFEKLIQCLEMHHEMLSLKGRRGHFGGFALSRDAHPTLLTVGTVSNTVRELFGRKEDPQDDNGVTFAATIPTFEAMAEVFVEAAMKELEASGIVGESTPTKKILKGQMLSLLNFNSDFLFNFSRVHDVYLSGLTGCSLITSFMVELALEIAQKLVFMNPAHNHLIGDLKELHEKGVRTFRDKHHKATNIGIDLVEAEERLSHLADLRRDFGEFSKLVEVEAKAIVSKHSK